MHAYRVQTRQGIIGPVKLETVRDLTDSGLIGHDSLVSRDDGPFVAIAAIPELATMLKAQGGEAEAPTYAGDLSVVSFMRILLRLFNEASTGLLVVRDATRRKDVYLEAGRPVFAASTIGKERLGEFMLGRGLLAPEQLRDALSRSQADGTALGAALVALGAATEAGVAKALRDQQLVRLADLCAWEHGTYAFFAGTRYTGGHVDLGLGAPELWVHAARSLPERIILRRLGDVLHQVILGFDSKAVELCSAHLGVDERLAAGAFDGHNSAVQVITADPGNPARRRAALTVLYLFWELGGVRFRPSAVTEAAPPRASGK